MLKISKELISIVLKIDLKEIEAVEIHNNNIYINPYPDCGLQSNYSIINVYEFIHKHCKDWVCEDKQDSLYSIDTYTSNDMYQVKLTKFTDNEPDEVMKFSEDSEIESLLEAYNVLVEELKC